MIYKRLLFLFATFMMFSISGCNAQDNAGDKCTSMLREFYTNYSKIWAIKPVPLPKDHYIIIDSLQEKYCTQKLRKEAKEWFEDGHDFLTNDWGIDVESLETMTIIKDTTKENTYIVSYIVDSYPVTPDNPVKKQVVLYVTVAKEGESCRLDFVR
ncbi:hypothetical protein [Gaoshiqia sp. Z1-71]|uniref:hypothetical protein n=1 Tax=Gaoshiqia hydrogeniformans TaxID=3290090 RepID=UPI003BF8303B